MKKYLQPIFLIALLYAFGCKETTNENRVDDTMDKQPKTETQKYSFSGLRK